MQIVGAGSAREGVRMGDAQLGKGGDWEYVFAGRGLAARPAPTGLGLDMEWGPLPQG